MNCPSCDARVPMGETICLECGTELVLQLGGEAVEEVVGDSLSEPGGASRLEPATESGVASSPASDSPSREAKEREGEQSAEPLSEAGSAQAFSPEEQGVEQAERGPHEPPEQAVEAPCPDCGFSTSQDANAMCSVCGRVDALAPVFSEDAFFESHGGQQGGWERRREALVAIARRHGVMLESIGMVPQLSEVLPLPGDRDRPSAPAPMSPSPPLTIQVLLVESGGAVFYEGTMCDHVVLDVDQLLIGRRDPERGHYPDIDLAHYRESDEHISRSHAKLYRSSEGWMLKDLCENDSTFVNDRTTVLNGESISLQDGDRILISDSLTLRFATMLAGAPR